MRLGQPINDDFRCFHLFARIPLGVLDPGDEDADIPSPSGHRRRDHPGLCRVSLHRTAAAIGDYKVPGCARLRAAQHCRAGRPHRLLDRNLHTQRFHIACPVARVGVRARGIPRIRRAAVQDASSLEDEPRSKLRAVPRPFPLGVVLRRERAEDVRLAEVLPPELEDSLAPHRHPAVPPVRESMLLEVVLEKGSR